MGWGTTGDDPHRRRHGQDQLLDDPELPSRQIQQLQLLGPAAAAPAASSLSSSSSHWSPTTPSSLSQSTTAREAESTSSLSVPSSSYGESNNEGTPLSPISPSPQPAVLHHRRHGALLPLPLPPHPRTWGPNRNNNKKAHGGTNDNMSLPLLSHQQQPIPSNRPKFPKRKTSQHLPNSSKTSRWWGWSLPVVSHLRRLAPSIASGSPPPTPASSTSSAWTRRCTSAWARRVMSQMLATFVVARFVWAVFWMHDTVSHTFPPPRNSINYDHAQGGNAAADMMSPPVLPPNSRSADGSDPASATALFSLKNPLLDSARRIISVRDSPSQSKARTTTGSGSSGGGTRSDLHKVEIVSRRRPRGPDSRHKRRRERTTPTRFRPDDETLTFAGTFRHMPHLDAQAVALPSRPSESLRMSKLCRQSGLDETSFVLVLGVDGLATSFLIVAAKHCGLRHVTLVDPMVPNLRKERLLTLQRHVRTLQRPDLGLNLDFRIPSDAGTLLRERWFNKRPRRITHVVAFQSPASYDDNYITLSQFMEESSHSQFHMHQSLLVWHQVVMKVQSQAARKEQSPPVLLYVSLTGSDATENREKGRGRHTRRQKLQSHLSLVLSRALLTAQQGSDVSKRTPTYSHLVIPADAVVGPFCSDALPSLSDDSRVVYVTDATLALFEALAASRPSPADPVAGTNSSVGIWTMTSVERDDTMSYAIWTHYQDSVTNSSAASTQESESEYKFLVMAQHDVRWRSPTTLYGSPNVASRALGVPADSLPPLPVALSSDLVEVSGKSFPCSSSCRSNAGGGSSDQCQPSVWEPLRPLSRRITDGCSYVVYLVIVDQPIDELPEPASGIDKHLCRVAFVHASSQLVQRELITKWKEETNDGMNHSEFDPHAWNGQIETNQWKLVWLNNTSDLSPADAALLKIDPSRMFANSVKRTLYAEYFDYVRPSDATLARVIRNVDRGGLPWRRQIERRHGVPAISRWSYLEPEAPKRSILFATEPMDMPKNLKDYVKKVGRLSFFPAPQLRYYDQLAHAVQVNDFRPESEIRSTVYEAFPLEWVSGAALVHDLVSEPAQELRCRWFDEYLHWGGNRNAEELSLSMVLATMRIGGEMGLPVAGSVDAPNQDLSWYPLLNATDGSRRSMKLSSKGEAQECFVRVMRNRKRK